MLLDRCCGGVVASSFASESLGLGFDSGTALKAFKDSLDSLMVLGAS